ncbi:hypothetical protein NQ318_008072, partial [Aromia moschata]
LFEDAKSDKYESSEHSEVKVAVENAVLTLQDKLTPKNGSQPKFQVASTREVSQSTVHRVLTKNKFYPYKLKMMHQLSDDNRDRILEFCENTSTKIGQHPDYVKTIYFSGESTFYLNGNNTPNVSVTALWPRD